MSNYTIRRAQIGDVPQMMPLLNEYARQAEILPRTDADVYQTIREWIVAEMDGRIVGMGSLLIVWKDLAEVRSLVIDPTAQGKGIGRKIVEALIEEARALALPCIFALTRKPNFFLKLDFKLTHIDNLPRKVQKDCVFCPKRLDCDEVALVLPLADKINILITSEQTGHSALNGHKINEAIIPLQPFKV